MPIFDWDGASHENKKAYDWDGTTSHPLGKGYDWDGSASKLLYTADKVLLGTDITDPSTVWNFHDKWVEREHSDGSESSYHVYCEKIGTEIHYKYGDHYADDAADVYAETKEYHDLTEWGNVYLDFRIIPQWASPSSNSKRLRIYLDIIDASGKRVSRRTLHDSYKYASTNIDLICNENIADLTGNHKLQIRCIFDNSYQEVNVYAEQCILQ